MVSNERERVREGDEKRRAKVMQEAREAPNGGKRPWGDGGRCRRSADGRLRQTRTKRKHEDEKTRRTYDGASGPARHQTA